MIWRRKNNDEKFVEFLEVQFKSGVIFHRYLGEKNWYASSVKLMDNFERCSLTKEEVKFIMSL